MGGIMGASDINVNDSRRRQAALLAAALVLAVLALYAPVGGFGFAAYDDDVYVSGNRHVLGGLTPAGVRWALTTFECGNWHPLTWISHMFDITLFGKNPGAHHLVSVALHAASTALLLLLLRAMTGLTAAAALVAALFGLHPLRVESVAWIAERKDVLSVTLWLLAAGAYLRHCRRPSAAGILPVAGLYALALMAKPMPVTFPFVLLLLDFWPLGRTRGAGAIPWTRLVLEKAPLVALAAASSVVTFIAQRAGGAVVALSVRSFGERLENTLVSYGWYAQSFIRPARLSVLYSWPAEGWPAWQVALAALFCLGATAGALRMALRRPFLAVGWLWYLGTLVPVIGLVQVGGQPRADRYTYLPTIGLAIAAVWGMASLARSRPLRRAACAAAAAALVALSAATAAQLTYWRDGASLLGRTLELDPANTVARNNLGLLLLGQRRWAEAEAQFREAVRADPREALPRHNLGLALKARGRHEEAVAEFKAALRAPLSPARASTVHSSLADALLRLDRRQEAAAHAGRALALVPGNDSAAFTLGTSLLMDDRLAEAVEPLAQAARGLPAHAAAHTNLASALVGLGRYREALPVCQRLVAIVPDDPQARYLLGVALEGAGRKEEAMGEFHKALELRPDFAPARAAVDR